MTFKTNFKKKLSGFTLAEVLITLGIIGIVAAMTLPTLVVNYQKEQTVIRLKRAYTILSQAVDRTKADYGDVSDWNLESLSGGYNHREVVEKFVKLYVVPYLAKVKEVKYTNFSEFGYRNIKNLDGSSANMIFREGAFVVLSDSSIFRMSMDTHDFGTEDKPDHRITNVLFTVDINGLKNPNVIGKDIFIFVLPTSSGTKSKLDFYHYYENPTRETVMTFCKIGGYEGRHCGRLIMMDGWQISDDYPW